MMPNPPAPSPAGVGRVSDPSFPAFIGYAVIGQQVRLERDQLAGGWASLENTHKRQPIPACVLGQDARTCATACCPPTLLPNLSEAD